MQALNKVLGKVRQIIAGLHLSRKVVAQATTSILLYSVALAASKFHVLLPPAAVTYAVPIVAGVVAGYLVPESQKPKLTITP